MARKLTSIRAALLSLLFSPAAFADDDVDTDAEGAPDAVANEVARAYPRAHIVSTTRGADDAWRVRVTDGLASRDLLIDAHGNLVAQAEAVPATTAPRALRRAVERQFGATTIWRTERVTDPAGELWRVTFATRTRVGEALLSPDGHLLQATFDVA